MNGSHPAVVIILAGTMILLVACGAPQPTSAPPPPTPTPTTIPPTASAVLSPEAALGPMITEYSVVYRNIPYVPDGDHQQKLSVYLPIEEAGSTGMKYPVVVLAHAYTMGKEDILLAETMRFVNQLGYAAVTIDYRDDDQSGNPWTAHNDGACAVAWVYANADTYGLDVDRMAAFGNSYGAVVLTDLAVADDPNVFLTDCPSSLPGARPFRGVIPFGIGTFGVPGEGLSIPSKPETYVQLLHAADTVEEMMAICDVLASLPPTDWATSDELSEEARDFAQTLPAYWVDSNDPPFLLLFPEQDAFWPQIEYDAFARLLEDAGVSFVYFVLPDAGHTAWGPTGQVDPATWQEPIQEFLTEVLGE